MVCPLSTKYTAATLASGASEFTAPGIHPRHEVYPEVTGQKSFEP
jgi:hypothetical protein